MLRVVSVFIFLTTFFAGFAQSGDSLYFKNFVYHEDNTLCNHTSPEASFTVYLSNDESLILTEESARYDESANGNLEGNGTFGTELANFINPSLQAGDSVFVRFTCTATGNQGTYTAEIPEIPFFLFPGFLYLDALDIPVAPQGLSLNKLPSGDREISWSAEAGYTYHIYRRELTDTLPNGMDRKLYERVAENINSSTYTDTGTSSGKKYGYILYAVSSQGVFSAHSEELNEFIEPIEVLELSASATTVRLSWSSFSNPLKPTKGYTIYRRTEGEPYGHPVGYTGLDTSFIDSRLTPGDMYYYKVTARYDEELETGVTAEKTITTESSETGYYKYANLKTAVIIYQNTNSGAIGDEQIPKIKNALERAKEFYWINSSMKLNLDYVYYPVTEYRNYPDPDDSWGSMIQTVQELAALGVMNTQYDIIFRITPAISGFWSYGVQNLPFPGPARKTGFSQSQWPIGTGVIYPFNDGAMVKPLIWVFVHEVQHALDALYNDNGHPEMYHGDVPWAFPVACGEHFDFQAKMFRDFSAYTDLELLWGDIYEAVDADEDGFPDNDPNVAFDELVLGSSSGSWDSDADGLSDREEAIDGTFIGSNPLVPDTDGDGLQDGEDDYPLYPVNTIIPQYTPVIDGEIEAGWTMLNDAVVYSDEPYSPELHMAYDADSLYIGLYLPNVGVPKITIDFQNDGWWWSSGNTEMEITPFSGVFTTFRSWDASEEVKQYSLQNGGPGGMWDNSSGYQQQFNRRVIDPAEIHIEMYEEYPVHQLEIAIPRNEYAGLTLGYGDRLALNVYYAKVNNNDNKRAVTFDQYSFVTFHLGGIVNDVEEEAPVIPEAFALTQNYPNPFNPVTTIEFDLPQAGRITLDVFNVLGQKVNTIVEGYYEPGRHTVRFNAVDLTSGIYLYRLKSEHGYQEIKKMLYLK